MKKLVTLILIAAMAFSCISVASAEEPVTISFWTHYTDDVAFTRKKVEDFNAANDGKIFVDFKHVSDDFNNVLLLALKNENGPDIYADGISTAQLVEQGYAAPLEDLMSPEMLARIEDKKSLNNNWLDDHWYSMPFRGYNFRLVWNKDLFKAAGLDPEAPPKTYEELIAAAKAITEYGATQSPQKFGFMLPTGEEWIYWIYGNQMAFVNGASPYDYATGEYKWEAYKPVMELYLKLKQDGYLFPGGTTMQNDPARAQFSAGNVGMIIGASWDIGVFNDQFPAQCEWGVAELPSLTGERKGYAQFDAGSYLYINGQSDAAKQKAAMTFYEYLLSDETLVEYYEGGYGVPVYEGIGEMATSIPDRNGFVQFAETSIDRVYGPEPPIQVEGEGYGAVMNSVLNGAVSLDDAIADLNTRYNAAIAAGVAAGDFVLEDYIVPGFTTLDPSGN